MSYLSSMDRYSSMSSFSWNREAFFILYEVYLITCKEFPSTLLSKLAAFSSILFYKMCSMWKFMSFLISLSSISAAELLSTFLNASSAVSSYLTGGLPPPPGEMFLCLFWISVGLIVPLGKRWIFR